MGWHIITTAQATILIFDRTEIITAEKNYWRRLIIEGMEIKKLGENRANRQVGYEIDDSWNPIIERLKS